MEWQINWNLWGNSIGARDFSPDWKHRYFGTEVPCPDNDKHQFIELCIQTLGARVQKAGMIQKYHTCFCSPVGAGLHVYLVNINAECFSLLEL